MPFYFQRRKGKITEQKRTVPFIVRFARKNRKELFFSLWLYPTTPKQRKKELSFRWDEVKFNTDLTEIKTKKIILKFEKK
jgi:hypothetical protein